MNMINGTNIQVMFLIALGMAAAAAQRYSGQPGQG
jgi:hypothetical protein